MSGVEFLAYRQRLFGKVGRHSDIVKEALSSFHVGSERESRFRY